MHAKNLRLLWLARLAVLLGAVEFIFRALLQTSSTWLSDLAAPYTSTRFWLAGEDPYNPSAFFSKWEAAGAPHLGLSDYVSGAHSVYPPPTLLLMTPFAMLRWPTAVHVFIFVGVLLYFASVYAFVRLAWPRHRLAEVIGDYRSLFFIAFSLGFAPIYTALHSLNIVLLAACAAMLGVAASLHLKTPGRNALAVGIAATCAILLKPTTGVFLLPWLAYERRWKLLAMILLACGMMTALAFAPLVASQGMRWLTDYRQNVTALFTHGGNADVSPENFYNTDRIDLQLVGFALFNNRTVASGFAAAAYLGLLFLFLKVGRWGQPIVLHEKERSFGLPLLIASGCLALGLLPSYTREYAAIVLLPLVLWCMTHLQLSVARMMMFPLCTFLINTSAGVRAVGEKAGLISPNPRLWDLFVGGHTCWLLLALGALLPFAARQQIATESVPVG